ncbi:MAG: uroporphyrinogen-III decarboxylase [Thermoleophilia bacterium]|nr:uroporphyrinogen-III decarboxylase [Thermoleophilia bacterium]
MREMTPRERIQAAIELRPVDRVPVIPKFDLFPFRYLGMKLADVVRDADLFQEAVERTNDEMGGGDAIYIGTQVVNELGFAGMGTAAKLPGIQLGEDEIWQMDEQEVMREEDYDLVKEEGWGVYLKAVYPRLGYGVPVEELPARMQQIADRQIKDLLRWEKRGIPVYVGPGIFPAFEILTYTRSLKTTLVDIRRRPEKVLDAVAVIAEEQIEGARAHAAKIRESTEHGTIAGVIGATRASFLRPEQFERFFWQFLKEAVDVLIELGVTPNLHFDGDWTRYLEYLLELPKGKVVLDLDGSTDIFKAKQILRGHMCIMGDVPASLLSLGSRDDVVAYCKNLIDVVAQDNGFILSSGCSVPIDARPENVRALIETAKSYYPHFKEE